MTSTKANAVAVMNSVKGLERPDPGAIMEQVIIKGDLAALSPHERANYYVLVCESMGLNPLTRPFEYIELDGKLTLYATRVCTDQLRRIHAVDTAIVARELVDGVYVVTARATMPNGRTDESIGAVPLVKEGGEWKSAQSGKRYFQGDGVFTPLSPTERANAMMKTETKAKRRVILSAVGLGWTDESELETIRSARFVHVDHASGEIIDAPEVANLLPNGARETAPNLGITERTMKAIHAAARPRGITHEDLHGTAEHRYGVDSLTKLTEAQGRAFEQTINEIPIPSADTVVDPGAELALTKPQQTWLGNIRKARSVAQLDAILERITNLQMLDCTAITDALEQRRRELDPEHGDADGEEAEPAEDDGRTGTPIRTWSAFWRYVAAEQLDVPQGDKNAIEELIGEKLAIAPEHAKQQVERYLAAARF